MTDACYSLLTEGAFTSLVTVMFLAGLVVGWIARHAWKG